VPLLSLLASIPSPSFSSWEIGPVTLRLYGLAIALGVVAAVVISSRRWEARGGHPDDIGAIALWAVPAGVIGSRIYHVATDWRTYQDDWGEALDITQGGLGIPGGIFFGTLVGWLVVRSRGLPTRPLLDVAAPAIPVAQAIGRLGNWFNQEVFGRPTSLPWGLEIDAENRPAEFADQATFHPTFLYEGLWNLTLAVVLVRLDRTRRLRPAQLFCLYVLGYGVGRLWIEMLRADAASLVLGVRINIWMSIVISLAALAVFAWLARGPRPDPSAHLAPPPDPGTPSADHDPTDPVVGPAAGDGDGDGAVTDRPSGSPGSAGSP
jgi:prolipoprotein diacylglyceryl transferase